MACAIVSGHPRYRQVNTLGAARSLLRATAPLQARPWSRSLRAPRSLGTGSTWLEGTMGPMGAFGGLT
jgi:hypothetical protein